MRDGYFLFVYSFLIWLGSVFIPFGKNQDNFKLIIKWLNLTWFLLIIHGFYIDKSDEALAAYILPLCFLQLVLSSTFFIGYSYWKWKNSSILTTVGMLCLLGIFYAIKIKSINIFFSVALWGFVASTLAYWFVGMSMKIFNFLICFILLLIAAGFLVKLNYLVATLVLMITIVIYFFSDFLAFERNESD